MQPPRVGVRVVLAQRRRIYLLAGFEVQSAFISEFGDERLISKIPAWIREMDDEESLVRLVLSNAQGEISPLRWASVSTSIPKNM